jgi:hypothetical protein
MPEDNGKGRIIANPRPHRLQTGRHAYSGHLSGRISGHLQEMIAGGALTLWLDRDVSTD